jgi:hypothetical protein
MTRKRSASTVDRSLAVKYFDKATRFKADAESGMTLILKRPSLRSSKVRRAELRRAP